MIDEMPISEPELNELSHDLDVEIPTELDSSIEEFKTEYPLKPRAYQIAGTEFLHSKKRAAMLDDPGLGKRVALGTRVLTEDAWTKIEDIEVGQQVFGGDGQLHYVSGIFRDNDRPLYRITFSDGATVDADDEHLWQVHKSVSNQFSWRVLSTAELVKAGIKWDDGKRKWRIPLVDAIEHQERNLPTDPYTMGVVVGDGSYEHGDRWKISTDKEILTAIKANAVQPAAGCFDGWVEVTDLKKARAQDKEIPAEYLFGSAFQRAELLAGLLDTDGWNQGTTTQFSTSSQKLATQVVELVRSLGGIALQSIKSEPKYTYKGETKTGRPAFVLTIRTTFNPFWLTRKAQSWSCPEKYQPTRLIESIERIGNGPGICLSVDSPDHLYVIQDYIVTHNTLQATEAAISPTLIVAPAHLTYQWFEFITEQYPGQLCIVADGNSKDRQLTIQMATALHIPWLIVNTEMLQVETSITLQNKLARNKQVNKQRETLFSTNAASSLNLSESERETLASTKGPRILTDYVGLLRGQFNTIILDEAHHFKSRQAKQSHGAHLIVTTPRPAKLALADLYNSAYGLPSLAEQAVKFQIEQVEAEDEKWEALYKSEQEERLAGLSVIEDPSLKEALVEALGHTLLPPIQVGVQEATTVSTSPLETSSELLIAEPEPEVLIEFDVPDEALVPNRYTRQGQELAEIASKAGKKTSKTIDVSKLPNVYLVTATPVKRESDDWYMLMHLLAPDRFTSYYKFIDKYCWAEGNGYGVSVYAPRSSLAPLVEEFCIRRTYEDPDVQLELPDIIPTPPIKVKPTGETMELIKMTAKRYRGFNAETLAALPLTSATQVVTGLRQINATDKAKLNILKEELENLPPNRPALIYVWYKSTAGFVYTGLGGEENAELISGEDNPRDRVRRVEGAFRAGKHVIATIASLSEGINVSQFTDNVFFYEEDYSYGTMFQALSRLRRHTPGQEKRAKRIVYIHLTGTIDVAIHQVWQRRQRNALDVLNALSKISSTGMGLEEDDNA